MNKEEKETHKKTTGWTTKEVALKLGVSESTIQRWCKDNNSQTAMMPFGQKPQYILFQSDIERIIAETPSVIKEAKQELTKQYIEEGIVVAKTTDSNIMRAQYELIGNLLASKELHEIEILNLKREQTAMHLELENTKETIEKHIINHGIEDKTMKTIRDLIHTTHEINNISIWHELHEKFKFNKLANISEDKGIAIIEYIRNRYGY